MALVTPPSWLQAGTYTAQSDRQNQQAIFGSTGVIGATSLAVTAQASPNMTVNIAAGWGAIVSSTALAGVYGVYNDATVIQTISAANATNPRIDLIVATVNDAQYSGALNNVVFTTVAGTPAVSPTVPATPSNSLVIAQIAVAAATTTISTANITDRRSFVSLPLLNPVAAGTTTTPALKLTAGTNLTTAAAGAVEFDGSVFYATPSATTGRGLTPSVNVASLTSAYAVTASTAATPMLSATGPILALDANRTYEIEALVRVQYTLGATSTQAFVAPVFTGTYTSTSSYCTLTTTSNTTGFASGPVVSQQAGSTNLFTTTTPATNWVPITPATQNVTVYATLNLKGLIRTTSAGNLNLQMAFSQVTSVTSVSVLGSSYFKVTALGSNTLTNLGAWS